MKRDWERAAKAGDAASLAAQLADGADVDARDRFGQSALMLAAQRGHLDAVELLVRAGAALDLTAKFGLSATMLAVVNQHEGVARALAAAGADLGLVGSGAPGFAGKSAAQLALDRGLPALARALEPPPGAVPSGRTCRRLPGTLAEPARRPLREAAVVPARRADESAQNLLEGIPGSATPRPGSVVSYTLVLLACGAAALVWKLLASHPSYSFLWFPDAVLALACACGFAAFLRVVGSPAAPLATGLLSIALAVWFPLGTAAFLYWILRVRHLERSASSGGADSEASPR